MPRRPSTNCAARPSGRAVPELRVMADGEWRMSLTVFKASDPGELWKRLQRGHYV